MDLLDRLLGHDSWTTERVLLLSRDLKDEQLGRMFHRGEALHILQRLGVPDLPEGDVLSWEARDVCGC